MSHRAVIALLLALCFVPDAHAGLLGRAARRAAIRAAAKAVEGEKTEVETSPPPTPPPAEPAPPAPPEVLLLTVRADAGKRIDKLMYALPKTDREVFYVGGASGGQRVVASRSEEGLDGPELSAATDTLPLFDDPNVDLYLDGNVLREPLPAYQAALFALDSEGAAFPIVRDANSVPAVESDGARVPLDLWLFRVGQDEALIKVLNSSQVLGVEQGACGLTEAPQGKAFYVADLAGLEQEAQGDNDLVVAIVASAESLDSLMAKAEATGAGLAALVAPPNCDVDGVVKVVEHVRAGLKPAVGMPLREVLVDATPKLGGDGFSLVGAVSSDPTCFGAPRAGWVMRSHSQTLRDGPLSTAAKSVLGGCCVGIVGVPMVIVLGIVGLVWRLTRRRR